MVVSRVRALAFSDRTVTSGTVNEQTVSQFCDDGQIGFQTFKNADVDEASGSNISEIYYL